MSEESSSFLKKRTKRLLCLGLLMVLAAGVPEPDGYRMDHYRGPVPETIQGGSVIHTAALAKLIEDRKPVLIDVLPAPTPPPDQRADLPRMPVPHKDIPGSIWLPEVGRGALSAQTDTWFRKELRAATHGNFESPVVFYCLSNCWMSWNATKRAISYGYTHAIWFPEGADGWSAAGNNSVAATPHS